MKAVQLKGFEGPSSLEVVDVERPAPGPGEILIEVEAAGLNWAELEQTRGLYPLGKPLPAVMGFEAAGTVAALGPGVDRPRPGDRVVALARSGGFAEYATADAGGAIPIPEGISFAEATTLPIQGLSAYALLKLAARPRPGETVLIQAAAGGVGLYLVQLSKLLGFERVVALASSEEKLELVRSLGADVAVNYAEPGWPERVREATGGRGVDVLLEMASREIAEASFPLVAPFGRIVVFGARNLHDVLGPERMAGLLRGNHTIVFFNVPTLRPDQLAPCVPEFLELVSRGKVRIFAGNRFPLAQARRAFEALASRKTVGKVVLVRGQVFTEGRSGNPDRPSVKT